MRLPGGEGGRCRRGLVVGSEVEESYGTRRPETCLLAAAGDYTLDDR